MVVRHWSRKTKASGVRGVNEEIVFSPLFTAFCSSTEQNQKDKTNVLCDIANVWQKEIEIKKRDLGVLQVPFVTSQRAIIWVLISGS